jgi:hypothetical protein
MHKKRLVWLSGAALVALLLVSLVGVTTVFAQEPTPETEAPFGRRGRGRGMGGFGGGMFGGARGGQWTMFDTAAEALGLTPEELFAELHAGKTLEEVAEAQGVEMEAVHDALQAARGEAMRQAIEQAVEDGKMSQEQADWMLEGLEQGFAPMGMGRGFGRGRGWGGCSCAESE